MSISAFIEQLIKDQDNNQIALLSEFDSALILKTVCALLNGDGGWIVVGHSGSTLIGVEGILQDDIDHLTAEIANRVSPLPLIYVQLESYGASSVVLLNVLKGPRPPYSLDSKYYVRIGRSVKEAAIDDISLLLRPSNKYSSSWERLSTTNAEFNDLDSAEIEHTITDAKKFERGLSLPGNANEFLSYFQLLDYESIKNGSIVLFGRSPTRFLAQCRIRITVLPEGKTGGAFADTLVIENNLFASFERVRDYFQKSLPMISEFKEDNWNRIDRKKYPSDALDEAIVNAMVHRDYADVSGEITINIYPNKMEIINSGEMPDDILSGKSKINSHHSVLRNPTIAHMFFLRGKMEKLGRGLSLIRDRFVSLKLPSPEWTMQNGYTTLTLFGVAKQSKVIDVNERMRSFLTSEDINSSFMSVDYLNFFKGEIKERTARADLSKMVQGGWLRKQGSGPATSYLKTDKSLPDIAG